MLDLLPTRQQDIHTTLASFNYLYLQQPAFQVILRFWGPGCQHTFAEGTQFNR